MKKHCSIFIIMFFVYTTCAFKLGIENCIYRFPISKIKNGKKARIALVANQTSCDQKGNRSVDILLKNKFNVVMLLATEHGFDGSVQASDCVSDNIDEKTKLPVVSLYGKKNGIDKIGLVPKDVLASIDCLIFDLQDAGMRHYTYLDTLLKALQSAASHSVPIIVCDRPNLLGVRMEGPQGNPRIFKKETVGSLPLRHGLTVGEIAHYFNDHVILKKADLHVIPMSSYKRTAEDHAYFKQSLSPNIACTNAVRGYSFLGVLGEVRPFDLGVGSEYAFQCIMLQDDYPFSQDQWNDFKGVLKKHGISSEDHRYFSKRKKQWYRGVRITIDKICTIRSFETLLSILEFFKNNGISLVPSAYFDTAVGNARVRRWLEGKIPKDKVIQDSQDEVKRFFEKNQKQFLYLPHPDISQLFQHKLECFVT